MTTETARDPLINPEAGDRFHHPAFCGGCTITVNRVIPPNAKNYPGHRGGKVSCSIVADNGHPVQQRGRVYALVSWPRFMREATVLLALLVALLVCSPAFASGSPPPAECNGVYNGLVVSDWPPQPPTYQGQFIYGGRLTDFWEAGDGFTRFVVNGHLYVVQHPNVKRATFGEPPQCNFGIEFEADPIMRGGFDD